MTEPIMKKLRCAVYTRKSSEEGLEQAFNSLDAQREAGVAYIASQKHEGWELLPTHYDDGGYSGGSTDRPALQQLLNDIHAGRVDVIVVYKVDRLSRSLHDFAQMMALFDKQNVSFVSVTQQFNTTTSMGRLTLNILLSFAQFEREVTGERIRDKFAASKKKGMWMGGVPPLGYLIKNRQLIIEPKEAELVKKIFNKYLECHSLLQVAEILNKDGDTNKYWQTGSGLWKGGHKIKVSHLNKILRNVIYIGRIKHGKENYEGQHEAIIDKSIWDQVQDIFMKAEADSRQKWHSFFLLKGKLKTHEGFMMSPTTTHRRALKNTEQKLKKQVRYYVSRKALIHGYKNCQIRNINANLLEGLVTGQLLNYLHHHHPEVFLSIKISDDEAKKSHLIRHLIKEIIVGPEQVIITIDKNNLDTTKANVALTHRSSKYDIQAPTIWQQPDIKEVDDKIHIIVPVLIKRVNGIRTILSSDGKDLVLPEIPKPDAAIVQAIGRGFKWRQMLEDEPDISVHTFAKRVGFGHPYVYRQMVLTRLAPDILHRALTGTLPSAIKLNRLTDAANYFSWDRQRRELGLI